MTTKKTAKKTTAKKTTKPAAKGIELKHTDAGRTHEYEVRIDGKKMGVADYDSMGGVSGSGKWLDGEHSEAIEKAVLKMVKSGEHVVKLGETKTVNVEPRLQEAAKPAKKEAKKTDKKPAAKKAKGEKAKRVSSGARIRELLKEGKETDAILATIKKEFPNSKATKADVSWNKWAMNSGHIKA